MVDAPSVFISYSTQDEPIGQTVRNLFEDRGHNVLLLKLLQHMTEEYIMDLLRNEVKARDWVVAVDTQHALDSNWVAFERAVAGIYHKPIYHVDGECAGSSGSNPTLQDCLRVQVAQISRQLRVFLSYSRQDEAIARRIYEALASAGYQAFDEQKDLVASEDWKARIQTEVEKVMERGVFIVLVSAASMASAWVGQELQYGFSKMDQGHGRIIPCLVEPADMGPILSAHQYIKLYPDLEQGIQTLLAALQHA